MEIQEPWWALRKAGFLGLRVFRPLRAYAARALGCSVFGLRGCLGGLLGLGFARVFAG